MPNVAPNKDDRVEESNGASDPPRTGPRSTDPTSRAAAEEVQVRETVRVDRHGDRGASIRTVERSIHSDGSRSVVTATTDASTGNATVEATKYPAPTFASVDGGIGPSEQNEATVNCAPAQAAPVDKSRSQETKRRTTSSEASGAAAVPPGPEEIPASDRLPVVGEVDRTGPDDKADRKIKMDSGLPEQVPATDRLPCAIDAASGAARDRKVRVKLKSPEKTEKRTMAAVGPEEVPPTEPQSCHHFYRDVASRVRWRGLVRWENRKNGGASEEALHSRDAVVPGISLFRNEAAAAPSADLHDDEFGRHDHHRAKSPPRRTRGGPDADEGEVVSEDAVMDIETGAGRRESAGSTVETPSPDEPTPLEAFAVVERERREVETQAPPSDPNERRAHEESLVRHHLLAEAVEGYIVPSGTKITGDRSKAQLEYLKRRPKMVCAVVLAVLALIIGVTILAVYVPRSSDDASKAIEDSANVWLNGNSSFPNVTQPKPDNKTEPPTVDPVAARYDAVKAVLGSVSEAEALSDELSPQGRALSWIARTDPLQLPHNTKDDVCHLVQRYVLATMYFATGGGDRHWLKDYHFLEGIHECHWWNIAKPNVFNLTEEGVFCSEGVENGTVTHLHMTSNNISGTLPDEMRFLSDLHVFLIYDNLLRGTIPNWLVNLTYLEAIFLESNEFTGTIPEPMGNLKKLTSIDLNYNSLSGTIPDSFANIPLTSMLMNDNTLTGTLPESFRFLSNLTLLYLSGNHLNGTIPASWGEMSSLQTLSLASNELTGQVPETLGNLGNLEQLYLFGNRLNGTLPSSLGGLKSLMRVFMDRNTLTGTLPESFRFLSNLEKLRLFDNSLNGTIPASWGEMSYLKEIGLWWNKLSGHVPETLGNLGNLEQLYLFGNRLNGTLPSSLGRLKSLKILGLEGNKLTGPIPEPIGNLTKLMSLALSRNNFDGTIPESVSLLHHLQKMHISENYLRGKIPNIGNLTSLESLVLHSNVLTGQIPKSLERLSKLKALDLSFNQLSGMVTGLHAMSSLEMLNLGGNMFVGPIPSVLGELKELKEVYLFGNALNGSIPTTLGKLTNLEILNVRGNKIVGHIPSILGELKVLKKVYLWDNALNGSIPTTLGKLTKLVKLALNQNQLVGPVPQDLQWLTRLDELWLFENMLSGLIPDFWGNMTSLRALALADNALYGGIPESIGRLTGLEYLYLNTNNLSGSIPGILGDLSLLKHLFLYSNSFSGQLPASLIELAKLEELGLFSNNITGSIPKDIDGMKSLRTLYLNDNALYGKIPESLGRLTTLEYVNLGTNNLTGSIPTNLGVLSSLRVLSLASNALGGHIPESFEQLGSLERLHLEGNNLSGLFPQTLGGLVSLNFLDVHDNNISGTMNILCENSVDMIADCSGKSPEVLCDCCLCYPGMRCLPSDASSRNSGPCKGDELPFAHYLQTDNYPRETSWYLNNATTDSVIAFGYNYDSTCSYFEEKCLPSDGCYMYSIFDSEGDGICCDYGHGQYNITFGGIQVASGGQFGSNDIHLFGNCTAS